MLKQVLQQTASKIQPESETETARRISPLSVDDVETLHHSVAYVLREAASTSPLEPVDGMMR